MGTAVSNFESFGISVPCNDGRALTDNKTEAGDVDGCEDKECTRACGGGVGISKEEDFRGFPQKKSMKDLQSWPKSFVLNCPSTK